MKKFDEKTYGKRIAAVYDNLYTTAPDEQIDLLAELAQGGQAFELGIGTGRVALPLQQRGIKVSGIDASQEMLERLRQKPGGEEITTHVGNFVDLGAVGQFDLIYVVFNTLFALTTQDEQVQCFKTVADHLSDGGRFLVEAFVPDLGRYDRLQRVSTIDIEEDAVRLDVAKLDPVRQEIITQHVKLSEDGIQLFPVKLRYLWPAEMDLMARLAGLQLKYRWSSWTKEDVTARSEKHISVYSKAA